MSKDRQVASRRRNRGAPVDVTIAVCTRNRAARLRRLLNSFTRLQVPRGVSWTVLVVDNRSSDGTAQVLADFAQRLPLQVVHEPRPGVANARNAALDTVQCKWLLCTDDDVTVSSAWLVNQVRAFTRHGDAAFVAGDIFPVFPGASQVWKNAAMDLAATAFAAFSVGSTDVRVAAGVPVALLPFGANLAFSLQHVRGMRFDAMLGRQPGQALLGGEETEFVNAILKRGMHGWLVAGNPVLHWIEADRQSTDYIERFFYGQGFQSGTEELAGSPARRLWYSASMHTLRAALPVMARFAPEWSTMRLRKRTSLFRGAMDGRRNRSVPRAIGHGVAGIDSGEG